MLAFADWGWDKWVVFFIPVLLIGGGAMAFVLFRHTLRTRLRVGRQLRDDPDINEWLIVFDWSRKVVYVPTILASFAAALAMGLVRWGVIPAEGAAQFSKIVGGVWLVVFIVNFLVDEYEMSVKMLAILILFLVLLGLWLFILGWIRPFFDLLGRVTISMNATVYLVFGILFSLAVGIAWIRGLFYYAAFTPNYLNVQIGPTETGEQVSREDYSTRVDTGDFLERLLGFGRIVVTFRDSRRMPMMFLVGRIGTRAQRLESIRGKLAVDRHQPGREGQSSSF
jgi:hypothetical protein